MPATATAFRLEVDLFRGARCFGRNPPRTEKVWGWSDAGRQVPCGGEGGPLRITILERASYCSGRFGAGLRFSASASAAAGGGGLEGQAAAAAGLWCNLGSQVLSAVNPSGAHANAGEAGHGMRRGDLAGAWRLAIRLRDEGLLLGPVGQEQEIDGYPLACTDERMWGCTGCSGSSCGRAGQTCSSAAGSWAPTCGSCSPAAAPTLALVERPRGR
ncbi:unnamed protein product [Prorocentrum cordatum]|uniref:Uncharacterized protein n=1 Tax=Prorocentrum cordatum TaxID=2364126 RepID=A0ABN9XS81_9DINO|nr:unnamed protein product [Polarella glacialis]